MVGTEWTEASAGSSSWCRNVTHDFENRGSERAGMLNVSAPGDFEQQMPGIAQWFSEFSRGARAWASRTALASASAAKRQLNTITERVTSPELISSMAVFTPSSAISWETSSSSISFPSL